MSSYLSVLNLRTSQVIIARARVCAGFSSRLRGLLCQRSLSPGHGALFVCRRPGRLAAAIHTFGLRIAIGVIWLDAEGFVVDMRLAKPMRFAHVPKASAMYYLEANPEILNLARIGDQLRIDEVVS